MGMTDLLRVILSLPCPELVEGFQDLVYKR